MINEDTHFYIDNASPNEVSLLFRILSADTGLTPSDLATSALRDYGFRVQKDVTYSPRRLYDLGLAEKSQEGSKIVYLLSKSGFRIQSILSADSDLTSDVLHYLHFTRYIVLPDFTEVKAPTARKNLWSYRRCCQLIWHAQGLIDAKSLAALILGEIAQTFPEANSTDRQGTRFNATAATCVYAWLRSLKPPPLEKSATPLSLRKVDHYELGLLALDDLYRARAYRYGDAVLLTDDLLDQVASVFFLDRNCCVELLRAAAKLSKHIKMTDTLSGPSINLLRPYTVDDL